MARTDLRQRIADARAQRAAMHRVRSRRTVTRRDGVRCEVDGHWLTGFCSNDYLGLSQHFAVVNALQDAASREGAGGTASHLVCGHHVAHTALETEVAEWLGVPALIVIAALVVVAVAAWLRWGPAGREVRALGDNPDAAVVAGIPHRTRLLQVYALSGALAGLVGLLWVGRYAIAFTELAAGYELTVIAACVIGGVSIGGGVGTVTGTILGALFLGIVNTALPVLQISPFWQMAIAGAVILAAIVINARAERRPDKLILPEARRLGRSTRAMRRVGA